ncbi:ATP-dependent DNA helicase [Trichonephila inaurata madagascariensis]|uniref:ATP-dependent DNA helicase n=1 Tax=Trichonephila inaurata madagascariensis TaxID=2747483 RepID=A0A8X7BTH4_9ARAC|nr:ATP-dependent DNA helicase [Trichonephila inaurata madagascariensis]
MTRPLLLFSPRTCPYYSRELGYDFIALQHQVTELIPELTPEQSHVFHQVLRKMEFGSGVLFFIDAPERTGKMILLNHQKKSEDSIDGASSVIAKTLLTGSHTAHSVSKSPLNLKIHPSAILTKIALKEKDVSTIKLLVWDESYKIIKLDSSGFTG